MKKCISCGTENTDESRFCKQCGEKFTKKAPVNVEKPSIADGVTGTVGGFSFRPVPDEEIRALVNRKSSLAERVGCTVLAGAVIIGLTAMACNVRNEQKREGTPLDMLCSDEKKIFLYDGERIEGSIKETVILSHYSADCTTACCIGESGKVYAVSEKGVEKIGEDAVDAVIAPNGSSIFYTNEEGEGYFYNMKNGDTEKISDNADISTAVFSPEGKVLAFNGLNTNELFIYKGKNTESAQKGVKCAAVSDKGAMYATSYIAEPEAPEKPDTANYEEYEDYSAAYEAYREVYEEFEDAYSEYEDFMDGEDICLYYYPNALKEKREKLTDELLYGAEFNKDITQVVFRESGGKTYFCKKGGTPERISRKTVFPEPGEYVNSWYNNSEHEIFDCASLLGISYRGEDTLYYVDKGGDAEEILDDFSPYFNLYFSENGKNFCYIDEDGKLYLADIKTGDKERISKDVRYFITPDNCKTFYVWQEDGKLYYIKKNGDKEKIDSDVEGIYHTSDDGIYYIADGDLYYANKTKTTEIDDSGEVHAVISDGITAMYCLMNEDGEIYETHVSRDADKKFDDVYEDYAPQAYSY